MKNRKKAVIYIEPSILKMVELSRQKRLVSS